MLPSVPSAFLTLQLTKAALACAWHLSGRSHQTEVFNHITSGGRPGPPPRASGLLFCLRGSRPGRKDSRGGQMKWRSLADSHVVSLAEKTDTATTAKHEPDKNKTQWEAQNKKFSPQRKKAYPRKKSLIKVENHYAINQHNIMAINEGMSAFTWICGRILSHELNIILVGKL